MTKLERGGGEERERQTDRQTDRDRERDRESSPPPVQLVCYLNESNKSNTSLFLSRYHNGCLCITLAFSSLK